MEEYSFKSNLKYMGYVFYRPKSLIDNLIREKLIFYYFLLPLILFTGFYEILYIFSYISRQPMLILNLLGIITNSLKQYRFFQLFLFPVIHILDYVLFWVVILLISKIIKNYKIDAKGITDFGMFTWNTIGLIAAIIDLVALFWPWEYWVFIHPICRLIGVIYGLEFIHKQSGIRRWKAGIIYLVCFVIFIAFRMLFLG